MNAIIKKFRLLKMFIKKKDPYLPKRILRGIYENSLRLIFKLIKHKGIRIVEEDWKYLVILDACRFDEFKRMSKLQGILRKKISAGSNTPEWIRKNFTKRHEDIIYITANPQMSQTIMKHIFDNQLFFKVEKVWGSGWDEKLNSVPPKEMTQTALKMAAKYPNKRIIIHYLQPHAPFISPNIKNPELKKTMFEIEDNLLFGDLDVKEVKAAWRENLRLVLDEIDKKLLPHLNGRVVISADHGEAFGEKGIYFHPEAIHINELVEIPWFTVDNKKYNSQTRPRDQQIGSIIDKLKI